jgi:hypothetical protein
VGLALAACQTPQAQIPPGYRLQSGGDGIAIFSLDTPTVRATQRQRVSWTSEETGESLALDAANEGPLADFHVSLPAGRYRMAMALGESAHVRFHLVRFDVLPGVVSYAGTIHVQETPPKVGLTDDYDSAVERFRTSHPELAAEGVLRSLAEVQACGSTGDRCSTGD